MTHLNIHIRRVAYEDIEAIWLWIANASGSPSNAKQFIDRIFNRIEELKDFPMIGVARPDLGIGLRHLVFEGRALIIYRIGEKDIQVTNVLYRGRDTADFIEGLD
jgi:toxin ParE1/3/4